MSRLVPGAAPGRVPQPHGAPQQRHHLARDDRRDGVRGFRHAGARFARAPGRAARAVAAARFKIGTFSAASNVTGILNDCHALARVLHRHGALAFFDYAAAGPYVDIDLHPHRLTAPSTGPPRSTRCSSRCTSFSAGRAHRGCWSPTAGSSPIACRPSPAAARCSTRRRPNTDTSSRHRIAKRAAPRRSWAASRRGSVSISRLPSVLHECTASEQDYLSRALAEWTREPGIEILGNLKVERLGVVSMIFKGMHHNYVVALLNDFFGIQVRGGCMCAGPYGHELLHIDEDVSRRIRGLLERDIPASSLAGCGRVSPLSPQSGNSRRCSRA